MLNLFWKFCSSSWTLVTIKRADVSSGSVFICADFPHGNLEKKRGVRLVHRKFLLCTWLWGLCHKGKACSKRSFTGKQCIPSSKKRDLTSDFQNVQDFQITFFDESSCFDDLLICYIIAIYKHHRRILFCWEKWLHVLLFIHSSSNLNLNLILAQDNGDPIRLAGGCWSLS